MKVYCKSSVGRCLSGICATISRHIRQSCAKASAADPAFVGVLALAVEQNAERFGLSEETLENLRSLIDQRENAAINLALEIRELPPVERRRRLEPFVAESERMGLAMLSVQQRSRLDQLRIQRAGMSTLAEPVWSSCWA